MVIETTKGPFDDSALERESVIVDDEKLYACDVVYRLPGTTEVICRMRGYHFAKVNPFETDPPDGMIPNEHGEKLHFSQLNKRLIVVDNDKEFSCAVEFKRPGDPAMWHRSAATSLKVTPAMQAVQGGVG